MNLSRYLNHPTVQPHLKTFAAGDFLFRQGQIGSTMHYLISGSVELVAEREEDEHIENILIPGDYFGERALFGDNAHQRLFGARAREEVKTLEIGPTELEMLQIAVPGMLADILRGVFEITNHRLSRANYLVRALRSSRNEERLIAVIEYFCRCAGRQMGRALEVTLSVDSIHYYVDMPKERIAQCLEDLTRQGFLRPKKKGVYLVPDETRLNQYLSTISQARRAA